jgi:hypothetical protein
VPNFIPNSPGSAGSGHRYKLGEPLHIPILGEGSFDGHVGGPSLACILVHQAAPHRRRRIPACGSAGEQKGMAESILVARPWSATMQQPPKTAAGDPLDASAIALALADRNACCHRGTN